MLRQFSGDRLRSLRERAGYSRRQLAIAVGRTTFSVIEWERHTCAPHAEVLPLIASALHCSIDDLYEDADARPAVGRRGHPQGVRRA
jgi:DNA-binding XRE family transcriptional regulator